MKKNGLSLNIKYNNFYLWALSTLINELHTLYFPYYYDHSAYYFHFINAENESKRDQVTSSSSHKAYWWRDRSEFSTIVIWTPESICFPYA